MSGKPARPRLQTLVALRAIASLLVVLFHVQAVMSARFGILAFGGLFSSGSHGVDLFFVLSGFLIVTVHRGDWGRPDRLGNYLYNRFGRIYPAVWIMSALAAGFYMAGFSGLGQGNKLTASSVAASVLLLPQSGDALVNVTWTLKYEMAFYLLFALTIINTRLGITVFIAWQAAILAVLLSGVALPPLLGFYLRPVCLEFGIGAGCALAFAREPSGVHGRLGWLLLIAGAAMFTAGRVLDGLVPLHELAVVAVFGGSAGLLITGLVMLDHGDLHLPALLTYLGSASYAIYLVHFSIISLIAAVLARHPVFPVGDVLFAAVTAVAVAGGLVFYELVDQPVQHLLRSMKPALLGVRVTDVRAGSPR